MSSAQVQCPGVDAPEGHQILFPFISHQFTGEKRPVIKTLLVTPNVGIWADAKFPLAQGWLKNTVPVFSGKINL